MASISNLKYSHAKKAIIGGVITVNPKYARKILQLKLNGGWCDLGRIMTNGTIGLGVERPFYIEEPQYVDIRIWKGPDLGSIYIGW